jgi:hypothetical protein
MGRGIENATGSDGLWEKSLPLFPKALCGGKRVGICQRGVALFADKSE